MSGKAAVQDDFDLYEDLSGQVERPSDGPAQAQAAAAPASSPGKEVQQPVQPSRAETAEVSKAIVSVPGQIYLGNLQWWTTDAELEQLCAPYGPFTDLKIYDERSNGKSKGYALVEFANAGDAKACKEAVNGKSLNGKNIVATFTSKPAAANQASPSSAPARPQGSRDAGRGRASAYGGRGRVPRPQQQDHVGYEDRRYPSPQPGLMAGMPMPPSMLMAAPMMPMGAMLPAGLPMPGMGYQQEQGWNGEYDGYGEGYKRQRFY